MRNWSWLLLSHAHAQSATPHPHPHPAMRMSKQPAPPLSVTTPTPSGVAGPQVAREVALQTGGLPALRRIRCGSAAAWCCWLGASLGPHCDSNKQLVSQVVQGRNRVAACGLANRGVEVESRVPRSSRTHTPEQQQQHLPGLPQLYRNAPRSMHRPATQYPCVCVTHCVSVCVFLLRCRRLCVLRQPPLCVPYR